MADTPRLPLIAPPRPVFPAQFDSSESSTGPGVSQASWPDDEPQGGGAAASDGAGGEAEGTTWTIKTEREQHLDRLEARLHQLRSNGSAHAPLADDEIAAFEDDLVGSPIDEPALAEVGDEEEPMDPDSEAGMALLSDAASPGGHDLVKEDFPPAEEAVPGNSTSDLDDAPDAPVERPSRPTTRAPGRISFQDSVRITSGFRGSAHRHRPRNALSPTVEKSDVHNAPPKTTAAPSDLFVQAVTPSASTSRSTSPFSHQVRRMSRSSSSLGHSASLLSVGSYPYSSSPASFGGASRSSSPCSSIYAPLQPPSRHCPNPLLVKPSGGPLRRSRSGTSFQDFLRKNRHVSEEGAVADESDEDSDAKPDPDVDEVVGMSDEPRRLEYHDLVEQQRAKKARWEARRRARRAERRSEASRKAPTLWTRVGRFLLHGRTDGRLPDGDSATGAAAPARSPAVPDRLRRPSLEHSPVRSSPLARATSQSSLSSVSSMEDEILERPHSRNASASVARPKPARPPRIKTEDDVRFGPKPERYFRASWWRYQVRRLRRAVARFFKTALAGWRASQHRKRERETGYGTV